MNILLLFKILQFTIGIGQIMVGRYITIFILQRFIIHRNICILLYTEFNDLMTLSKLFNQLNK